MTQLSQCSQQCRRQSKRSERAPAENGGALKRTEIFHIKIDVLPLQITRSFKNFVFMFEKRDVSAWQRLLARFLCGPHNHLKNLSVNAIRRSTRALLGKRGLELKVKFFCTKTVEFRPSAEQPM